MKRRGIAFQIFGVLMLFASSGFAAQRPTLKDVLQKIQEIEDLVKQSYAISFGDKFWGGDDLDDWIISPGNTIALRGARSTNSNANMNINRKYPSRYSSRYRDDDSDDEFGSLGMRDRYSKVKRNPKILKRHIIRGDNKHRNFQRNRLRYTTNPSTGRYSKNQNLLSVKTVRYPYGSRSFGGSRNYNSNINENVNTNTNDENRDRYSSIDEFEDEELDYY